MFVNYLAQRVSVAPFEVALHALPRHGLSFTDLLSGHFFGDDISCLYAIAAAFDRRKIQPHVSFFKVLHHALTLGMQQAQVVLGTRTSLFG